MKSQMKFLVVLLGLSSLIVPVTVSAVSPNVVTAYKEFAVSYARLPSGSCDSTSLAPFRDALDRLTRFETLAEGIDNAPDLSDQRSYLTEIIDSRDACFDRYAGISFRCDGPCPSYGGSTEYKKAIKLPSDVSFDTDDNVSVNGLNVSKATFRRDPELSLAKSYGTTWYEYDARGNKAFTFEEVARDDWSVYLNDASRDVQLQIDVHRMWITYGVRNGPKRDLYKILDVEGE